MKKLILTNNSASKFSIPCANALLNYEGPIFSEKVALPHPGALVNNSWNDLLNRAWEFMDAVDAYDSAEAQHPPGQYAPQIGDPSIDKILNCYRSVLYIATELIEDLLSNLKTCLLSTREYKKWKPQFPKRWKDHPTKLCNKLKHEHNILYSVNATYPIGTVRGFTVGHYSGRALISSREFHEKQQAFALGADLRRVLAHVYLIADAVREQIEELSQNYPHLSKPHQINPHEINFLNRVNKFMPLCFHDQIGGTAAEFSFDGDRLVVSDSGAPMKIGSGETSLFLAYSGDGYTKSFPLIYRT